MLYNPGMLKREGHGFNSHWELVFIVPYFCIYDYNKEKKALNIIC